MPEKRTRSFRWVFVKQFSRNDTATACQDWLRVPGWAEDASSPMSAPSRCWHGAFCISGVCTPLSRCNTLDFVPKSCAKVLRPFGIPAHIACGRCGFAAQKALTKAHPAVCGEEKALLQKCNNPLWHFHPCGLQSVVGSPRGNEGERLLRESYNQVRTMRTWLLRTHPKKSRTEFK